MHNAPSVTYPVGRSRFSAQLLTALWLAGACAVALWTWQSEAPGWRHAAGAASAGMCGLAAAWGWRHAAAGELGWDASGWSWNGAMGALAPGLDLQHALLLRWRGEAGAQWLWVERARSPTRWDALRRAVYSRATPDALQGAQPPAAKP